jgi:hypothetical protein
MIYMQCKCGEYQFFGSGMEPAKCAKCKKCGTRPATGPNSHVDPLPHEFVARPVETDEGNATLSRCKYCYKTRSEVEREEATA